jgi:hypothetical protein
LVNYKKEHEISIPIEPNIFMKNKLSSLLCILLMAVAALSASNVQIIESTQEQLLLSVEFSPWEANDAPKEIGLTVGLPNERLPQFQISGLISKPVKSQNLIPDINISDIVVRWEQTGRFRDLNTAVLVIAPLISRNNIVQAVQTMQITIPFEQRISVGKRVRGSELGLYRHRIINWNAAQYWVDTSELKRQFKFTALPTGDWYRIPVTEDGMAKITYSILEDAGISVTTIDPRYLRLYTNPQGGRPMPSTVGVDIPENLIEMTVSVTGEDDGSFDSSDEILFYARGPRGFDASGAAAEFTQNPYTDINYYWLLVPAGSETTGLRVETVTESPISPIPLDYGIAYLHLETDSENPYESGIEWFGITFTKGQTISNSFPLHNPKQGVDATLDFAVKGAKVSDSGAWPAHIVKVYQQSKSNGVLETLSFSGVSVKEFEVDLDESLLSNGTHFILLENASTNSNSNLYRDWLTLQYGRELVWEGDEFEFWSPANVTAVRFTLEGADDELQIWDITHITEVDAREISLSGGSGTFETSLSSESSTRYVAFSAEDVVEVEGMTHEAGLTFTDLRNSTYPIDHIIISPTEFLGSANELADYRENSVAVPLQTIYNEFSGGVADPLAIRYFLKWTKENWRDPTDDSFPRFVLLFGDGDYDYRNITGNSNNRVPTFQSLTLNGISSDDRFVYLDGSTPDMAIGRFTAATLTDAEIMVSKTIAYESDPEMGLWRRRITLLADDFSAPETSVNTEKSHVVNNENVANQIPIGMEIRKIYSEGYPAVSDGSSYGITRPNATQALFDVLEEGTALLNFIGHGNPNQWTHETLLSSSRGDLSSINTGYRLPIWIAGTCSWGKYDNVSGSAMSEELMRMEGNGAIATISTTDPISFSANEQFIDNFFNALFENETISNQSLGVIFQSIKTGGYGSELFHLFGDPALKICIPGDTLSVPSVAETLTALETANYSGTSANSQPSEGNGYAILYDSETEASFSYTSSDNVYSVPYTKPGKTLFRGAIEFSDNEYDGGFILPKDVTIGDSSGKLVVYLFSEQNNSLWEGLGVHPDLSFEGGTSNTLDTDGPQITFSSDSRSVGWGDHLTTEDILTVELADPIGINLTGEVGHSIRIWQDEDETTAEDVTDLFVYNTGSYTEGTLSFPLQNLNNEIMLTIEAWDNANNVSKENLKLNLVESSDFTLSNVFNYPNPFSKRTQFAFEVSQSASISIKVYTLTGQLVTEVGDIFESHYGYSHIDWNGRDEFGDEIANGAYIYQLTAEPEDGGKKISVIGKLAKYR